MKRAEGTASYPTEQAMRAIEASPLPANLAALIEDAAKRYGERKVAVFFDDDECLTYRGLARDINRLASALAAQGVGFGDHVGLMIRTCSTYPIAWLALAKLGAVAVPINPAYTARELAFVVDDADVGLLIVQAEFLPLIAAADLATIPAGRIVVADGPAGPGMLEWAALLEAGDDAFEPRRQPGVDDPVNIQYTSGTTGLPKGAIIPHGFWLLRGKVWQTQICFPVRRNLVAQPLHYIDGQAMLLLAITGGGTAYVAARQSASRFLKWVADFEIEFCSLPEVVARQLATTAELPKSLRIAYAYSHRRDSYRENEALLGCPLRQGYGMTELGSSLYVPVEANHMTGSGSVGIPVAHREVMIADEAGNPVAPGEIGEFYVRGRHMFLGYYKRPEALAAAVTPDGWFRTGDLGRQDEAGWFYFLGRRKDMVRRSSENISALEVEEVLRGMPGVIEAAVLPVPDDTRGEEIKAYLRLEDGCVASDVPPDAVIAHCDRNLARFKVPRYIEYVEDFPRTPGHKIKKSDLVAAKPDLRTGSFDAVERRWLG